MSTKKKLGQRLKAAREIEKISAKELAELIQIEEFPLDENNIYKWERGSIPTHPIIFQKLNDWISKSENGKNSDTAQQFSQTQTDLMHQLALGNLKVTMKDHFDLMKEKDQLHVEYKTTLKEYASIMKRIIEAKLLEPSTHSPGPVVDPNKKKPIVDERALNPEYPDPFANIKAEHAQAEQTGSAGKGNQDKKPEPKQKQKVK